MFLLAGDVGPLLNISHALGDSLTELQPGLGSWGQGRNVLVLFSSDPSFGTKMMN